MTWRVGASREATGIAADQILGTLDLDPALPGSADDHVVTCSQARFAQNSNGDGHLMFA